MNKWYDEEYAFTIELITVSYNGLTAEKLSENNFHMGGFYKE